MLVVVVFVLMLVCCGQVTADEVISLGGQYDFMILQVLQDNPEFNYFFTLMMIFGVVAVIIGSLVRIITHS